MISLAKKQDVPRYFEIVLKLSNFESWSTGRKEKHTVDDRNEESHLEAISVSLDCQIPLFLKHKSISPAFSREHRMKSEPILLEQMKGQELALSGVTAALGNIYASFCLALSQSPSPGVSSLSYSLSVERCPAFSVFFVAWFIIPPSCLHVILASWFFWTWLVQGYIHV